MTAIEVKRVDMGARRNGRVMWRRIFEDAYGRRFIIEKGRRLWLITYSKAKSAHIHYLIEG